MPIRKTVGGISRSSDRRESPIVARDESAEASPDDVRNRRNSGTGDSS